MTDTLFSNTTTVDETKDYLTELVGEGKKFKDVSALAKGKAESDLYIEQLKRESQEARQELQSKLTLEELVRELRSATNAPGNLPTKDDERELENKTTEFKLTDIESLLESKLSERERKNSELANLNTVKSELQKVYGNTYAEKLQQETSKLGLEKEFVDNLAKTKPQALLALLGVNRQTTSQNDSLFTPPTSIRSIPTSGVVKDWAYYEKIRKEQPTQYFSANMQNEMFKAIKDLGEEVFYRNR